MTESDKNIDSDIITVWIAEDDISYKKSIKFVLDNARDMDCAHIFSSAEELLKSLKVTAEADHPDVILLDIHLPGSTGIDILPHVKEAAAEVAVVMLTIADETELVYQSFRRGASGYILKDAPVEQLLQAIREASRGGTLMPPAVAQKVLSYFKKDYSEKNDEPLYGLSEREKDVLKQMGEGLSQKQIAAELFISPHTVNSHIQNIYGKLQVNSGIEAVAKAVRERLI